MDAPSNTMAGVESEPPLGIGKQEPAPSSSVWAIVLAILVGAAAFALIWKMRKTFGMKE